MTQANPSLDGLSTLDDLIECCQQRHYHGWTRVAYCSFLVARRFRAGPRSPEVQPEDPPELAFSRGAGTPQQRAACLAVALKRLGIEARVAEGQVRFNREGREDSSVLDWAWVRATLEGETRDVSASDPEALPGQPPFKPVSEVHER